ncbi:hypothetical protein LIER_22388 [Lithospermum erythrorhizon]|uniref:Uncharacterized protein n=1 Tax=Lithospermum erythrorhizon TaxID=34254 RepID=A0AAV3QWR9_LITER
MVAISLYRGNLHKVPDVPRSWLMPARKISLKDFKTLIRRRNRTLSRLTTTTSNPDLKPDFVDLGKNGSKVGNFIEIGEMGCEKIDGKFDEIGKNGNFEEIGKNGNKYGKFKGIGKMGCEKNGKIDGKFDEIGKNGNFEEIEKNGCVKNGNFEEIGRNGYKDGNFKGIGKMGCEKIGRKDGKFEEIGKNGCEKNENKVENCKENGDKDGNFKENGFEKNGNRDGNLKEIGCEEKGKKDGNWGEIEKNLCESKGFEAGELVEEEGNGKDEGGVEKLVEATESMVVEVKDGMVGSKGSDLDGGDVARIDREGVMKVEKVPVVNPILEISKKEEDVSDKQKRRQEIEEKLKILNEKKHSLVQALKQILNAEEELKRRSNIQGIAGQPPVGGGQVEGTRDSGSMSRHNTPRMGSEGNVSGEAERAETGDANQNAHLRHLGRMSSTSPSSDTQQRKSPFITATLPSRTNSGVGNSPSRFALAGQQGLPPTFPSVSVSGTNYAASSPSPAANGGTSAFRDRRVPSPWS